VYTAVLSINNTTTDIEVHVANTPPTLVISGPGNIFDGVTYTLDLLATDPGADTISGWTITWGDGVVQPIVGNPSSVQHQFQPGTTSTTISATASDEDGTYSSNSLIVGGSEPIVANPIADVTANEDGDDDVLDLSSTFVDQDAGDSLTLSITGNTSASLVTATVNGTSLTLDYLADQSGTAEITVRATDSSGLFVEDTFTVTVLSAQVQVQNLIDDVQELGLNAGNTNALTSKLNNAINSLDQENITAGVNQIQSFINQVNAFVNCGKLTQADGDGLIDAANAAITSALPGLPAAEDVDLLFADFAESVEYELT
jgi:hypothetical protein